MFSLTLRHRATTRRQLRRTSCRSLMHGLQQLQALLLLQQLQAPRGPEVQGHPMEKPWVFMGFYGENHGGLMEKLRNHGFKWWLNGICLMLM